MPKDYLEKYNKLIKKMEHWNFTLVAKDGTKHQDTEMYHSEQDVIYRTFIKDIATGKINNIDEIITLSKLLNNKVVKKDKNMWYS
jgi:hypothetical protein